MVWLVFETFLIVLVAIVIGILLGVFLRTSMLRAAARPVFADLPDEPVHDGEMVSRVARRPAEDLDDASKAAIEPAPFLYAAPEPAPSESAVEPVSPAPVEVVSGEAPPTVAPAPDTIIDSGKAAAADQVGIRPFAMMAARDGQPDDLKRIKGIGPQNEARLNALGIFHFEQIAAWTPEEARWIGSYMAFPGRIERENWITQAAGLNEPAKT